jgi:hypothetical protein
MARLAPSSFGGKRILAKLKTSAKSWTDPNDAPQVTEANLARGSWQLRGKAIAPTQGKTLAKALMRGQPVRERLKAPPPN